MSKRVIMRASLQGAQAPDVAGLRAFATRDREQLGILLFEAYLGTIDQEEETVEQAHAEIAKTIDGDYGTFLPEASMVIERHSSLHSAALVTRFRNRPFLAFSITAPLSKNQGLARACINAAMARLLGHGEHELHLVVTRANDPAFHLYKAMGFEVERDV